MNVMMRTTLLALALLALTGHATSGQSAANEQVVIASGTFLIAGDTLEVDEGRFTVPANRSAISAATLSLRFVRFRSTAAQPGAPIVFLAGGPGDAATRAFRGMPREFLDELRAIADVIAFDQRGTGMSEPLKPICSPGAAFPHDHVADPARMLDTLRARVTRCLGDAERRGISVAGLTTAESADDLEALRRMLGVPKVSVLAGSYGTHLALAAARRHPELIQRMALAGVEGPDDTFKDPARVDQVLATIAAARRPSLVEDVRTLRRQLAANSARIATPDGEIVIGEWDLQRWIADALDAVPEIDAMVAAIPLMLAGDFNLLARWGIGYRFPHALNLMNLAMDCASYASPERLKQIQSAAPTAILGDAINFPLPQLCDVPGIVRLGDDFRAPLRSDVPALLISGTFDGRTPVQNAQDVARGMPNARLLVVEGASHGLFREQKVLRALLEFLRGT